MSGKLKRYAYINAKLRGRISKITPDDIFLRMAAVSSPEEALQLLSSTSFAEFEAVYTKTGDIKMVEHHIRDREISLYLDLEQRTTGVISAFIGSLSIKFEIENIKNTLRLWFNRIIRKMDIDRSYLYRRKIQYSIDFDGMIDAASLEEIVAILHNTPYSGIISSNIDGVLTEKRLFKLEMDLDIYFYKQLFATLKKLSNSDSAIAHRILGVEADIQNINMLLRFKRLKFSLSDINSYFLSHGTNLSRKEIEAAYSLSEEQELLTNYLKRSYSGLQSLLSKEKEIGVSRLYILEKILNKVIQQEIRKILSGPPFTIGILLAYFLLKEYELKKIMMILNAVAYGINENQIKGEL